MSTPTSRQDAATEAMNALAGSAKRTGRSVRGVAQWAHNQRCATNNAMFAARVDTDHLLAGTSYAREFGQSPFAIARGARVEAIGRANSYAVTVELLRKHFGFAIPEVIPLDLRHGFQLSRSGMAKRAKLTAQAVEASIRGDRNAPNIIDGAVLEARIGGFDAHLEADGVGAKTGPVFHVNEFKGWPVVDGQVTDADKLGQTLTQMGIYRYLLTDLVDRLGGRVETVSPDGLLVTPRNVGLTLMGTPIDLARHTAVAENTLANLPDPAAFIGAIPPGAGFGLAGDQSAPESSRLAALDNIVGMLGSHYQDSCLRSCGLAAFCRARASAASDPALAGVTTSRFMPGIVTLRRAADLADGAPARSEETATGAAEILSAAGTLYREKAVAVTPPPNSQSGTAA